jgi:Ca2+-binding EF-hand superfamily protein
MKTVAQSLSARFVLASCLALGIGFSTHAQTTAPSSGGSSAKPEHPHHGHGPKGERGIAKLDKDGNKSISRDEAKGHPHLEKDFDVIDTNKDGQLSPDELHAHMKKMRGERKGEHKGDHMGEHKSDGKHQGSPIKRLDTNKDGQLSREEAKGHPMLEKNFDRIDANKDGQLSEDELKAARKSEMEARMKNKSEPGK